MRKPSYQRTNSKGAFRRATKPSKVALGCAAGIAKASLDRAGLTVQFGSAAEADALCLPQWRACCKAPRKDGSVVLLVCAHCGAGDHLMRNCPRRLRLVVAGDSHCAVLGRLQHLLPLRISWVKVRGASAAGLGNPRSVLRAADAMLATLRASFVDDGGVDRIVIVAGQVDLDFVTPYRALRKARSDESPPVRATCPERCEARLAAYRATFEEQLARAIAGLSAFIGTRIAGASAPLLCASRVIVHGVHPPPLNNNSMALVIAKHIVAPDRPRARRPGDPRSTARGSTMEEEAAEAVAVAPLLVGAEAEAEADADAQRAAIASELLALLPTWQERTALSMEWNERVGRAVRNLGCAFVDVNAGGALLTARGASADEGGSVAGVVQNMWVKGEWAGASAASGEGGDIHLNQDELVHLYAARYAALLAVELAPPAAAAALPVAVCTATTTTSAGARVDGGDAAAAALRRIMLRDVAAVVVRVGKKKKAKKKRKRSNCEEERE